MPLHRTTLVVLAVLSLASACKDAPAKPPQQAGTATAKPNSAGSSAPSSDAGGSVVTDARVATPDASAARDANTALDEDAGAPTSVALTFVTGVWGSSDNSAGTSYCLEDNLTKCVIADSTGSAVVPDLTPNKPYILRVSKDGFVPELKHFLTFHTDFREAFTRLIRRDVLEGWAASRGVTLDPSKGHVAFFVLGAPGGDIKVGSASGTTQLNFTMLDAPDPSQDKIGASGFGLVLNVDPGMHDVVVTRAGYKCSFGMETGWPGSEPSMAGVVVKPGLLSAWAYLNCLPKSP